MNFTSTTDYGIFLPWLHVITLLQMLLLTFSPLCTYRSHTTNSTRELLWHFSCTSMHASIYGLTHVHWLPHTYSLKRHTIMATTQQLVRLPQLSDLPITQTVKFSITLIHLITYRHCNEVTETPVIFFAVEQMLYFWTQIHSRSCNIKSTATTINMFCIN